MSLSVVAITAPSPPTQSARRAGNTVYCTVLRARLDNGYSRVKVGVEYDGREFHTEDDDKEHDEKRRGYLEDTRGWRLCVATREDIFGESPAFEIQVGAWIGIPPQLPRRW